MFGDASVRRPIGNTDARRRLQHLDLVAYADCAVYYNPRAGVAAPHGNLVIPRLGKAFDMPADERGRLCSNTTWPTRNRSQRRKVLRLMLR